MIGNMKEEGFLFEDRNSPLKWQSLCQVGETSKDGEHQRRNLKSERTALTSELCGKNDTLVKKLFQGLLPLGLKYKNRESNLSEKREEDQFGDI